MELQLVRLQFKIRSGFGAHLDEGREVALEAGQFQVRDLEDVVADVVEEACVDSVTKLLSRDVWTLTMAPRRRGLVETPSPQVQVEKSKSMRR